MRNLTSAILVVGAMGGCSPGEPVATKSARIVFDPFPAPGALCSSRRTIVFDPGGACDSKSGWAESRVFPGATASALMAFCRYEYLGSGEPSAAAVASLVPAGGAADPDCLVVTPAATPMWNAHYSAFLGQIDPGVPVATAPSRTWVGIVDSSPPSPVGDGEAMPGNSEHGYVLGRIARSVGCPDGPSKPGCNVHVHHELALPWRFDGTTWKKSAAGGDFGYQSDLAAATHRAVQRYLADRASPADRLVINLSLGWLPAFGSAPGGETPVRAVHTAIEEAVCHGALVVAAAGNWSGGTSHHTGAILPAAWNDEARPSVGRCDQLEGPAPGYSAAGGLVEAVGGVDGRDWPLPNGRAASTPRLVAPGFRGTAHTLGGSALGMLTGTSVSAGVASTAAALAWAFVPDVPAVEIADAVYASGVDLNYFASPGMCVGTCAMVHRVSVCGAVESVCMTPDGPLEQCPMVTCAPRGAYEDARPDVLTSYLPAPDYVVAMPPLVATGAGACDAVLFRPVGMEQPAEAPCPDKQGYSGWAHPDVVPQPDPTVCPQCFYREGPTVTVYLEIDAAVVTEVHTPSVLLRTASGDFRYNLWEAGATLMGGKRYEVTGLPHPGADIREAHLTGTTDRGESIREPLGDIRLP
ncbi:MAG: S8/S53 family peptidase [Deltaproteobacteria bacterium]|jgi:hypothetical protein